MNIQLEASHSFIRLGHRSNQEDCRYPDADICTSNQGFYLVCDGVGGADAGEIASSTVCDVFKAGLSGFHQGDSLSLHRINKIARQAYDKLSSIQAHSVNKQMATTLTFLAFHSEGVIAAHLGDSRIYHVRPGIGLRYKSKDHSLVEKLKDEGLITEEQAQTSPHKNVITGCIMAGEGSDYHAPTIMQTNDVCAGDVFLLCTDGVHGSLPEPELIGILGDQSLSPNEKLNRIATLTSQADDNNTAVLITVHEVSGNSLPKKTQILNASDAQKKSFNLLKKLKDFICNRLKL